MAIAVKTVGIKLLKDQLSAYLQEVKRGARILITDRDRVVAELCEPAETGLPPLASAPLLEWVKEGKIRLPRVRREKDYPISILKLPQGTAKRLLDEVRGE